jgi:two-component system response regulator CpxR
VEKLPRREGETFVSFRRVFLRASLRRLENRFCGALPRAVEQMLRRAREAEEQIPNMRPKKVILCVDDNEQALSVRKFLLETRGYRVITATSGEGALELMQGGGVDLVLSDLVMPQMDGNEMIRRMKQFAPEVPMVLISGTVKAFERANRADAFLPKGATSPVELLERIRVMIARKRGPKKAALRPIYLDPLEAPVEAAVDPYTGAGLGSHSVAAS